MMTKNSGLSTLSPHSGATLQQQIPSARLPEQDSTLPLMEKLYSTIHEGGITSNSLSGRDGAGVGTRNQMIQT